MVDSSDLGQVLAEAEDIARSVSQKLTSAHVVLALFTVDNPGARLLRERGVDEDGLLAKLNGAPTEAEGRWPKSGRGPRTSPGTAAPPRWTACTS